MPTRVEKFSKANPLQPERVRKACAAATTLKASAVYQATTTQGENNPKEIGVCQEI